MLEVVFPGSCVMECEAVYVLGCNLVLEVEFPWSCVMECEAVCIMTLKSGAGNLEKGNKRNVRVSKRCRWITAGKYFENFGP